MSRIPSQSPYSLPILAGLSALLLLLPGSTPVRAQDDAPTVDPALLQALHWRMVGPFRGGRSTAVTGHASDPDLFVMGGTGGGVWRSDDGGNTWDNVSDGFFGGSIGSVDIADADPNVIYVGTGSADVRGNTSMGRGAWKSTDGGETWSFLGLGDAGQIGSIESDPRDADVVFAAALGHPFGPNEERGLYRSRDGGTTWERVLYVSERTGAMDVQLNPRNPRVLYASMWTAERKPWTMISGSEEGGIWKSSDGGDTWSELTAEGLDNGLPSGVMGKIGLAVSPADPDTVWALIEAQGEDGGLFRSRDGGGSWERVNGDRSLRQRAWYYTHLHAHPTDADTVFAINTRLYRSFDGGRTLEMIRVPHGDVHDLWVNPADPERMIVGDDGGAQVSVNGGRTWTTFYNQPTAELYDVAVDDAFPYYLYAGQQDNTGIAVPAWTSSNTLYPKMAWKNPGGCETGPVAVTPRNPDVTYGGCYGGAISYVNTATGEYRDILSYPQLQSGQAARDLRYRFQWTAPILVSQHDPSVVYHASNRVHRTSDGGFTWETVSPDLTTDNPEHQDFSGGPIHHDITGVEIYGTIFALAESPTDPDELWAGSDDGRVHVTRDGGATWTDVTPDGLPPLATVDEIELSAHAPGRAFIAAQRYRLDDFRPFVFRTDDWGASWTLLTDGDNGIPADTPVRTVREDLVRRGLLFAGTEYGVYVSFDEGARWQSLQLDLPITPVTGMRVHRGDLVISTQGRSFWILDDMTPLRAIDETVAAADVHLFTPRTAWRANMAGSAGPHVPEAPPQGATIHYTLSETAADESLTLEIVGPDGTVVRAFTSEPAPEARADGDEEGGDDSVLPAEPGLNRFVWDLQYEPPDLTEDAVVWGYTGGPKAVPGTYTARLTAGDRPPRERGFEVRLDPRLDVTDAQLQQQLELSTRIRDRLQQIFDAVRTVRTLREQVLDARHRAEVAGKLEAIDGSVEAAIAEIDAIEGQLITVDAVSTQDLFNYRPMLASEYAQVYQSVTGPDGYIAGGPDRQPTEGAHQRIEDLEPRWQGVRQQLADLLSGEIDALNAALVEAGIPGVAAPEPTLQ